MNKLCNDFKNDLKIGTPHTYSVMSIDVGVINLGMSISLLDESYQLIEIIWIDLIDITKFRHQNGPSRKECNAYHTKTFADWLNHFYQENLEFFEMVDYILIERQPPMGFVVVEQLIFDTWREKAVLISPNSLHKYFGISHLDYDQRKKATEKMARLKIKNPRLLEQLSFYVRQHDISDSICIMVHWADRMHTKYIYAKKREEIMKRALKARSGKMSTEEWFEHHRFVAV